MATSGYVSTFLNGLPADVRRALTQAFDYPLTGLRLGRAIPSRRAENLQMYFLQATTPATANEEFTIEHQLGRAPYLLVQVLPLDSTGGQLIRLGVSRAADASRIYLTSPETEAPVTVLVEG